MNETKTSCAPADSRNLTWDGMDWSKCEAYVRKLQARIVKAQKEGRHNKVKALQWMLTHFLRQGIGGKEGYFQQREENVWSR